MSRATRVAVCQRVITLTIPQVLEAIGFIAAISPGISKSWHVVILFQPTTTIFVPIEEAITNNDCSGI